MRAKRLSFVILFRRRCLLLYMNIIARPLFSLISIMEAEKQNRLFSHRRRGKTNSQFAFVCWREKICILEFPLKERKNHGIDWEWQLLTTTTVLVAQWSNLVSAFSELFVAPRELLAAEQKLFLFRHRRAFIFHERRMAVIVSTQHISDQEL